MNYLSPRGFSPEPDDSGRIPDDFRTKTRTTLAIRQQALVEEQAAEASRNMPGLSSTGRKSVDRVIPSSPAIGPLPLAVRQLATVKGPEVVSFCFPLGRKLAFEIWLPSVCEETTGQVRKYSAIIAAVPAFLFMWVQRRVSCINHYLRTLFRPPRVKTLIRSRFRKLSGFMLVCEATGPCNSGCLLTDYIRGRTRERLAIRPIEQIRPGVTSSCANIPASSVGLRLIVAPSSRPGSCPLVMNPLRN